MPRGPGGWVQRLLRQLPPPDPSLTPDAELLARYAQKADQAAFELLVWRHGGLVLGTCQRILQDAHHAEDAFQATFLILARKSGSISGHALPAWLHQVARRVALRALKKHRPTQPLSTEPALLPRESTPELQGVLDTEIARLPERLRLPVLLCYLQEWSTQEAANHLGIPRGTVLSRMAKARERLAERLTRKGFALPMVLVAGMTTDRVAATVNQAVLFHTGKLLQPIPASTLALEVLRMMTWKPIATVATTLVLIAGVGTGVGVVYGQKPATKELASATAAKSEPNATLNDDKTDARMEEERRRLLADKKIVEKQNRLEAIQRLVQGTIRDLEDRRSKIIQESNDDVDVKILVAELERRDTEHLRYEKELVNKKQNEIYMKKAFEQEPRLDNVVIERNVSRNGTYQGMLVDLRNRKANVETAKANFGPDHPSLKKLIEELAEMEKKLEAEKKQLMETYTAQALESQLKDRKQRIQRMEEEVKDAQDSLIVSRNSRKELVARIAKARSAQFELSSLEADLQLYQEIRQQLQRAKILQTLDPENTLLLSNDNGNANMKKEINDLREEVRKLALQLKEAEKK